MIPEEKKYGWCRSGLRTRYQPKARICRGLINAAPWLDVVLIIVFFLVLASRVVLQPGTVVELPRTAALQGTQRGLTAVVLPEKGVREEMVFFDDEPFVVKKADDMKKLRRRLAMVARDHSDVPFIIEADVNVRHGTIVMLCNMAREAGLKTANLAVMSSEEETGENQQSR